jgi:hypothetical protein
MFAQEISKVIQSFGLSVTHSIAGLSFLHSTYFSSMYKRVKCHIYFKEMFMHILQFFFRGIETHLTGPSGSAVWGVDLDSLDAETVSSNLA